MGIGKKELKKRIYNTSLEQIKDRVANIETAILQAEDASADDPKSSAGDKYETTREMMQQEIERNQLQLIDAKKSLFQLEQLKEVKANDMVVHGSLIYTNRGLYYLAISLGQMIVNQQQVIVLSLASPLGQVFHEKNKNESFTFNGIEYTIEDVL